jgi:hypothetical protein
MGATSKFNVGSGVIISVDQVPVEVPPEPNLVPMNVLGSPMAYRFPNPNVGCGVGVATGCSGMIDTISIRSWGGVGVITGLITDAITSSVRIGTSGGTGVTRP